MTQPTPATLTAWPTEDQIRAWTRGRRVTLLVVHHAARDAATAAGVRRYHMAPDPAGKGWREVGYHLMLDETGRLWSGRSLSQVGAHAAPHNTGSVGVCALTDSRTGWSIHLEGAMVSLLADLCRAYGLGADAIRGHGELSGTATECPALPVVMGMAGMDRIREIVGNRLAGGLRA
jgi:N-acetylmuramoyl-L-alanine amidase